jgi:uncharacterized protein (DUF1501 family)
MISRRKMLGHGGTAALAALAAALGAGTRQAHAADYKAVIVVFLNGGFDGNNVMVPVDAGYTDYSRARRSLALPKDSLLTLTGSFMGRTLGVTPSMQAHLSHVSARLSEWNSCAGRLGYAVYC